MCPLKFAFSIKNIDPFWANAVHIKLSLTEASKLSLYFMETEIALEKEIELAKAYHTRSHNLLIPWRSLLQCAKTILNSRLATGCVHAKSWVR